MIHRHSFDTAIVSNWVYTMDLAGFEAYVNQLAAAPLGDDEEANCLVRVARQTIKHDMTASERQWRVMQTAFTYRKGN